MLNAAAERAGWATPLPPRTYRGIALNEAYNTFVAAGMLPESEYRAIRDRWAEIAQEDWVGQG